MPYVYSMIRFVPDPARGEFINIGAIAGSDEARDWDLRLISNLSRAKAIDPKGALPIALAAVGQLEASVRATDQLPGINEDAMSLVHLSALVARWRNVIQVTPPTPLVSTTAADALDLVFSELVLDPAQRTFRFVKKSTAVAAVSTLYRRLRVPGNSIARLPAIRSEHYRDTVDLALHAAEAVQLVRCWSFQLPDQAGLAEEVKSWAWTARELIERGGILSPSDDRQYEIGPRGRTEIAVVYIPPIADAQAPAFDEARAVFTDTGIVSLPITEVDRLAATPRRFWAVA